MLSSPPLIKNGSSSATRLLSPVWTRLTKIQPKRAAGIYLYEDEHGDDSKRYMDFTSGIGVTNTGHCHPAVVQAIQEQASKLIFGQINIVVPPVTLQLAEKLEAITPPTLNQFFFSNSGAEAVEASIKLARHATHKTNIIVFQGSFHGRSHQTMAMTTAKYIYRTHYQPLPSGIITAPFPNHHYYHHLWEDEDTTIDFCLRELETIFRGQSKPDDTAAMILEPVLGEGGYVPTPPRFMRELRQICNRHNILLIADEVQSGFGRTGKMFAMQHYQDINGGGGNITDETPTYVEPDILVMAKGLGSGMPISAIASRDDLMNKWIPGSHGGTYGGGAALSAAAAVATIDVIQNDGLLANAAARGHELVQALRKLQNDDDICKIDNNNNINNDSIITHVRGMGLMVACEFATSQQAKAVQQACLQRHLLLLTCGTYENIIRWIPPLIVTQAQMQEAIAIFEQAVAQVAAETACKQRSEMTTVTA